MFEIIPGILAHSVEQYGSRLDLIEHSQATWVHVDIMDGQFVPNTSVMPHEIISLRSSCQIEAHLMTFRPERYYSDLAVAGVSRVLLHREAFDSLEQCAAACKLASDYFAEVGVVLNADTLVEPLQELPIQVVQCMGVPPGASGQPFESAAYDTISLVVMQGLRVTMAADGAVSEDTARKLQACGVSRFVITSRLFAGGNLDENISRFNRILQGGTV